MQRKPLIGLPACVRSLDGQSFHTIGDKYVRAVALAADAVPVMLPSLGELLDIPAALEGLDGSLTGTIHAQPDEDVNDLVDVLSARSGRVLFGGWPTGVAVNWAQQHGGPYPATTSIHTSVGATAGRRFQRPVAYQDAAASALPPALRDDNPLRVPRRVDGVLQLP